MTEALCSCDMSQFTPLELSRASELLGKENDDAILKRALIYQRDTGLSIARGEISVVTFKGNRTVIINKQGYLAYACRQADYDGYESGCDGDGEAMTAWCTVYSKTRTHPTTVKIKFAEFKKTSPVWQEKPSYMLEKTAISLALRAAFPVFNGTYDETEVEGDIDDEYKPAEHPPKKIYTINQAQTIQDNMAKMGIEYGDLFDRAKLPGTNKVLFDGTIIDEEFRRMRKEKNDSRV